VLSNCNPLSLAPEFIDAVYDDIATVRIYSPWWVDFLHVVKARGSWKLFHVTWQRRRDDLSPL
jgi:hypothetical protein